MKPLRFLFFSLKNGHLLPYREDSTGSSLPSTEGFVPLWLPSISPAHPNKPLLFLRVSLWGWKAGNSGTSTKPQNSLHLSGQGEDVQAFRVICFHGSVFWQCREESQQAAAWEAKTTHSTGAILRFCAFDWEAMAQIFVSIPFLENHPLMSALLFIYFLSISFQYNFFLNF